jgi:hypothetical protein
MFPVLSPNTVVCRMDANTQHNELMIDTGEG